MFTFLLKKLKLKKFQPQNEKEYSFGDFWLQVLQLSVDIIILLHDWNFRKRWGF